MGAGFLPPGPEAPPTQQLKTAGKRFSTDRDKCPSVRENDKPSLGLYRPKLRLQKPSLGWHKPKL